MLNEIWGQNMSCVKVVFVVVVCFISKVALADLAAQKAWTIHNRIAGVPPAPGSGVLENMASEIRNNPGMAGAENASKIAMQNRYFYDLVLKNWFKPWANVEVSKRVPLNDFVATMIGAFRDSDQAGKPFSRVLYADLVYVGGATGNNQNNYSPLNNNHYEQIEYTQNLGATLVERQQSQAISTEPGQSSASNLSVNGNNGAAGVLTSRAYGDAFYNMGTNRRVTRYTLMNFMCKDLEDLHDTSLPDFRVRRDVTRTPGGDSRVYKNKCVGCHAGQDALGGAFAYYDYVDGQLVYTPGNVQEKINRLPAYAAGFVSVDDSWINLWGQLSTHNKDLGFKGNLSGSGVSALGLSIAESRGFSICMAKKSLKLLCIRPPMEKDNAFIEQMANELEAGGKYNMKDLFAKTMAYCVEDRYEN